MTNHQCPMSNGARKFADGKSTANQCNTDRRRIGHWTLVIHWTLDIGHWSLVIGQDRSSSIYKHKLVAIKNQPAQIRQPVLAGVSGEIPGLCFGWRAVQSQLVGGGDLRVQ